MGSQRHKPHRRRAASLAAPLAAVGLALLLVACASPPRDAGRDDRIDPQATVYGTVDVSIVDGLDDAEEYASGSVNRSSSDLNLGLFPTIGMRFQTVAIPQGSTIDTAYLQFTADETDSGATSLILEGEAADDAAALLGQKFNLSSRPRTVAAVSWDPLPWASVGEAGAAQRTPNVAAILQEIVDRPGWASGNSLVLLVTGVNGERVAESYNGAPSAAPLLHVEFHYDDNPPSIDAFGADPTAADLNEPVTFSWLVSDPAGQDLSCTLDVDDDGAPEYAFPDCTATTQQDHAYPSGGEFVARLVVTDSDGVSDDAAVTVNVASSGTSVAVAAAGDIACDPASSQIGGQNPNHCQMQATADLMLTMLQAGGLDAVLPLGDVAYEEGTLEQFNATYDPSWGNPLLRAISYPAVGNHEYLTPGADGYFEYFGSLAGDPTRGYYSYDLGDWHIVVLNSSCSQVGGCSSFSPQGQWLRADLAASTAPCTLAYWHIPLFSSGRIGGRPHTQDFWVELHDAGAEVVLVGHDHNYERFAPQDPFGSADPVTGIRQFVVGTGGKSVLDGGTLQPNSEAFDNDTLGVLTLTLHPSSYDWQFVPIPGKTFTDTGSHACH